MTSRVPDDSRRLLLGLGRFVDDISLPGMLWLGLVRSPYPHAAIRKIDISRARRIPGFRKAYTGEDVTKITKPIPPVLPRSERGGSYALAVKRVRYVGEPVVAVLCSDKTACEDAVDAVEVDYERLGAISNPEDAVLDNTPLIYEDWGTNILYERKVKRGDVEDAFRRAEETAELRIVIPRQAGAAIEPRAVLAHPERKNGKLTLYSQSKTPWETRTLLSRALKLGKGAVDVIKVDVGGNFGPKGMLYPEDILAGLGAMQTGRPVKWVATRTEELSGSWQGRGQIHAAKIGFTRSGKILGLRDTIYIDAGALWMTNTISISRTLGLLNGAYSIPNFEYVAKCVVTNKVPLGPVRGNGRPEAILFIESVMDLIAKELGLDPAEVRLKNLVSPREMPYDTGTGSVLDVGDLSAALRKVLHEASYQELRARQRVERENGKCLGIGIGVYVEDTGDVGFETAEAKVNEKGKIMVYSGAAPSGQGIESVLAELAAKELSVPLSEVKVVCGDTRLLSKGGGTFASRSTVVAGNAVKIAASRLREKIIATARHLFREDAISLESGEVKLRSGKVVSLMMLAARARRKGKLVDLVANASFDPGKPTFSSGVHLAVVEVDPESFMVQVRKYYALDDAGRVMNLANVEGQVVGGVMHGLGSALFEDMCYDKGGTPFALTFMDYGIPTSMESVPVELVIAETPSRLNPLGVRGVGEGGTIGALASLSNAVQDALGETGTRILELPLTADRLWKRTSVTN